MTVDQAYAAGRDAACLGRSIQGFPFEDDLFRAWIQGPHCRGSGRLILSSSCHDACAHDGATIPCDCNIPCDNPMDHGTHERAE